MRLSRRLMLRPALVAFVAGTIVGTIVGAIVLTTTDTATPGAATRSTASPSAPAVDTMEQTLAHPSEPKAISFTVAVTGDVLTHGPVLNAARLPDGTYDFEPLLAGLREPLSNADLALCHLEVPLTREASAVTSYPVFNAPAVLADALVSVGYDGCSVASNHAMDQGADGVVATLRVMDRAGLGHAGTARSAREGRRITSYDVQGASVAHLSYTFGLNGFTVPVDQPWMVDRIEPGEILGDARRARRRGADLVLVSLHWGVEYTQDPTTEQRELASELLASPAVDALIGHHAHVVQPVERVRGKPVIYGLGNLLSNQAPGVTENCCPIASQDGVLVRLHVRERPNGRLTVRAIDHMPTMVEHPERRVVLIDQALPSADGVDAKQLRASRRRTKQVVGPVAPRVRPGRR